MGGKRSLLLLKQFTKNSEPSPNQRKGDKITTYVTIHRLTINREHKINFPDSNTSFELQHTPVVP